MPWPLGLGRCTNWFTLVTGQIAQYGRSQRGERLQPVAQEEQANDDDADHDTGGDWPVDLADFLQRRREQVVWQQEVLLTQRHAHVVG